MKARGGFMLRGIDPSPPVARLVGGAFLLLVTLRPTIATSQDANAEDRGPNTAEDVFRPPLNLFQLMYEYRTAPGSRSTVTTDEIRLRLDHRVDLSQQSMLVLRSDLPLVAKDPITSNNPNGDFLYGAGDADIQSISPITSTVVGRLVLVLVLSPQPAGILSVRESGKSCPSRVSAMRCPK